MPQNLWPSPHGWRILEGFKFTPVRKKDTLPEIRVINQPFGGRPNRVGDHLVELLSRGADKFDSLRMAVAFAKASGVAILLDPLTNFVRSGGQVIAAIGIDQQGTSRQGLELLLQAGVDVTVFHNAGADTFHPKVYLFQRDETEGVALVGSNNLTRGGLYENFEFSVRLDHNLTVPADAQGFQTFVNTFQMFTDLSTGMALHLDPAMLAELDRRDYLLDESTRIAAIQSPDDVPPPLMALPPLFRRVPMPRGPRPSRRTPPASQPLVPAGQALATFTMTLGNRDARQQAGYSRDIFVPIGARDANPTFWGWPALYAAPVTRTSGNYLERRMTLRVTPPNGVARTVTGVRIYEYAQRDEFRLNCGELVNGAFPGDVLVLSSVQAGAGYDYEASVIPQTHPLYAAFSALCTNVIVQSGKRWGYS
jgi:HKD family nuclease